MELRNVSQLRFKQFTDFEISKSIFSMLVYPFVISLNKKKCANRNFQHYNKKCVLARCGRLTISGDNKMDMSNMNFLLKCSLKGNVWRYQKAMYSFESDSL